MKKVLLKVLSWILAVNMVASVLPMTAFAAGNYESEEIISEEVSEEEILSEEVSESTEVPEITETSEVTETTENTEPSEEFELPDASESVDQEVKIVIKTLDTVYSADCSTDQGVKEILGNEFATTNNLSVTPVWNEKSLTFLVDVMDKSEDDRDQISLYIDPANKQGACKPIVKTLKRIDATATTNGYQGVISVPVKSLTAGKMASFCSSVTNWDGRTEYTPLYGGILEDHKFEKSSEEYYQLKLIPNFEGIVLADPTDEAHKIVKKTDGSLVMNATMEDTINLKCSATPRINDSSIIWSSIDPSIAVVDSKGTVNICGYGKVEIRATVNLADGSQLTSILNIDVGVMPKSAMLQGIADEEMYYGSYRGITITAKIVPAIASGSVVTRFTSSDSKIIYIESDANGTPSANAKIMDAGETTLKLEVFAKSDTSFENPLVTVDKKVIVKFYDATIQNVTMKDANRLNINVLSAAFTKLSDIVLPEEVTSRGYGWKYPDTLISTYTDTKVAIPIAYTGTKDRSNEFTEYADDTIEVTFCSLADLIVCSNYVSNTNSTKVELYPMYHPYENANEHDDLIIQGAEAENLKYSFTEKKASGHEINQDNTYKNTYNVVFKPTGVEGNLSFVAEVSIFKGTKVIDKATATKSIGYSKDSTNDEAILVENLGRALIVGEERSIALDGSYDAAKVVVMSSNENVIKVISPIMYNSSLDADAFIIKGISPGTATITVTYKQLKETFTLTVSQGRFYLEYFSTGTIDKNLRDEKCTINVLERNTDLTITEIEVKATRGKKDYSNSFFAELVGANAVYSEKVEYVTMELTQDDDIAKELPTGKYKITLVVHYKDSNNVEGTQNLETMDMTIIATEPKFTVKQTKNVNLFYAVTDGGKLNCEDYRNGYGELQITSKDEFSNCFVKNAETEDFQLVQADGSYFLYVKSDKTKAKDLDKKIELEFVCIGYRNYVTSLVKLNVAVEDKAPKLVIKANTTVLYPVFKSDRLLLGIYNTTNDSQIMPKALQSGEIENIKLSNSTKDLYILSCSDDLPAYSFSLRPVENKTGNVEFEVKEAGWKNAIKVKQKITVNNALPTMTVKTKSVTLNTQYAAKEMGSFTYSATGMEDAVLKSVVFSVNKERDSFVFNVEEVNGTNAFTVALKNGDVKTGTYTVKATPIVEKSGVKQKLNTVLLSIKVINKAAGVTVTQNGKIDVLRRNTTSINFTPKLSNIMGTITGCSLIGVNNGLFNVNYTDGVAVVKANENAQLRLKSKYTITLKYVLKLADGSMEYLNVTKTISVTQGKIAIKVLSHDEVRIPVTGQESFVILTAMVSGEYVDITQSGAPGMIQSLSCTYVPLSSDEMTLGYSVWGISTRTNNLVVGKTYTFKMEVCCKGAAVDAKPQYYVIKVKVAD